MHQSTLQQALCLLPFLPSVCIAQSGVALAKDSHADDQVVMLQTVARGRVAGQEDISKRSLLSDRLPSCTCEGGKDATCPCSNGCCRFETCYPGQDCGSATSDVATGDAGSAPTSDGASVAEAAGCSSASLLQTQDNCGVGTYDSWDYTKKEYCCKVMRSPPAGCSASLLQTQYNCNIGTYDSWGHYEKVWCCKPGVMQSPPEGCSSPSLLQTQYNCNIGTYDSWGYYEKEWCCKPGVMQSPPDGCNMVNAVIAPGAQACCGVLQQTAVAAGCSPSLLQIPGGGMVSATAGAATSATTAAVSETASVSGSYVTVQQTGAAAGCTLSLLQGAENTACCASLQQAAAAAGCSGPSLLQERWPGDEEYEEKKNDAKSKAENKKDDAKSKAENKKDDAKSKAENKKDNAKSKAENKKDDAKSKAEDKKDDAKSKAENKKDSELERW